MIPVSVVLRHYLEEMISLGGEPELLVVLEETPAFKEIALEFGLDIMEDDTFLHAAEFIVI